MGTAILAQVNLSFVVLLVMSHNDLLKAKGSDDTYYHSFRSVLAAVSHHNRRMEENQPSEIPSIFPEPEQAAIINRILFPVYFPNPVSGSSKSKAPEALKFGHQVSVAISSFMHWLSASKKDNALETHRAYLSTALRDRQLRRGIAAYAGKKEEKFANYLASGDLANRGLMDRQEIGWLVDACAFEGDKTSPFTHNRRLQRLGHVALAALLSNKHFQTGEVFQVQLRNAIVKNAHCLGWLVKAASGGGVSFCPVVSLNDFGKLTRFARGGTCTLYRAKWNEEVIAVKLFNEEERSTDIRHEVALLSLLRHPNVLPVYAYGTSLYENSMRMFCVSPYAERGSLYSVLRDKSGQFDHEKRIHVLQQAAVGVEHLHSLGLIHRDLKSLNILIREDWAVWVADIGATRIEADYMTVNVGTPFWMAPETFTTQEYSQKADVYSFGMILFEMITGKQPFEKISAYEVPILICKGQRPPLPANLAKPWHKLITSMWSEKPSKRPTMHKVGLSLTALQNVPFLGP